MPARAGALTVEAVESDDRKEHCMARYLVERTFPGGLAIPEGREGAEACRIVVERNELAGVTWLHSYVSEDRKKTYCVYDGPSPEAIRKTASDNDLPIDGIAEVRVLDPYLYF
jgi:Protein of unknown function (DUF4242)